MESFFSIDVVQHTLKLLTKGTLFAIAQTSQHLTLNSDSGVRGFYIERDTFGRQSFDIHFSQLVLNYPSAENGDVRVRPTFTVYEFTTGA